MGGKNKRPWQWKWTLLGKKGEETSLTSDFGYTHQSYLNAYHQWLILTTIQAASTLDILLRSPNNIASCLYVHRSFCTYNSLFLNMVACLYSFALLIISGACEAWEISSGNNRG
jgi:hypothetical protein